MYQNVADVILPRCVLLSQLLKITIITNRTLCNRKYSSFFQMCDVKVVTDLATIIESIINLSSGTFVTFFEVLFMFVCLCFFLMLPFTFACE